MEASIPGKHLFLLDMLFRTALPDKITLPQGPSNATESQCQYERYTLAGIGVVR